MSMLVNFAKMHGLGNDFVLIDFITQNIKLHTAHIRRIMDRHLGIGSDQLILIEPPIRPNAHFYYRIYNQDGHEVEQCGNGARCAARFFYENGLTDETSLYADCLAGNVELKIEEDNSVTVNMGYPKFNPKDIPFIASTENLTYPITVDDKEFQVSAISLGNPHLVIIVPDLKTAPIQELGPLLSKHPQAPYEANVGFMQIIDRSHVLLRVYERGVGETLACGSGASAAMIAGHRLSLLDNEVTVDFPIGKLHIRWEGLGSPVYMRGPTTGVFVGRFRL